MPKLEKEVIIKNKQGLHARPAAMFVQTASKYNCDIVIRKEQERVNGKSIMGILTLGAHQNCKVVLEVNGDDAQKALEELEALLSRETLE